MRTPHNERLTPDIADTQSSPTGKAASGSERRCVLSGHSLPREQLIRLAISPDGDVLPDPGAKAPGRGAWIAQDRAALEAAISEGHLKGALARAFKGASLNIPSDLPDRVEAGLQRSLLDRLGLELRAGNVVMGSGRIEDEARAGRLALLMHASDASEDGRKKLDQAWRVGRMNEGSGERGMVLPLDRAALSVALGRDNVVHLGVFGAHRDAHAAQRIGWAVERLRDFAGSADNRPDGASAPNGESVAKIGDDILNT